jgi:hypothetical protein
MSLHCPLWYKLPLVLTSFRSSIGVGSLILILAAAPMILWWAIPHDYIVDWLTEQAWTGLLHDPYVQSLEPERQAAIPKRIADVLWAAYPKFATLGLAAGIAAAAAYVIAARLLRPVFSAPPEPIQVSPSLARVSIRPWIAPIFIVLMGFVAHVPYIEKSLNIDEAFMLQRMMSNGWYWADTRWGWQIHVGGLLLVHLSTLLFGYGAWAVRLPAVLLSSAALGLLYAWVRSLHGSRVALLTAGLVALWPNWAEQCATARGYGLSFACGVLALVFLWRLLEEDRPHILSAGMAVWLLFFAVLFGSLAHFFWMFFGLACLLLLLWKAYFERRVVAAAAAFFSGIALSLAGLVYAPGLPATLFQMITIAREGLASQIRDRFILAYGFRADWPENVVITCVMAGLGTGGLLLLGRSERRRILLLLFVAVALPLCLRPVYLYPRFFLHLCFLWYVPMLPLGLLLDKLFRPKLALAAVTALLAAGVLWVRPWAQLPMTDLRALASYCQATGESGEPCVLDAALYPAAIYSLGSQTHFVSLARGIPSTAQRIARGFPSQLPPPPPPEGFQRIKFFPGWESNIEVLER